MFTSQTRSITVPTDWAPTGCGDINGDLKDDLFWRNSATGETSIWFMSAGTPSTTIRATTVAAPWIPSVYGDFDGDGKDDLLWQNTSTGETSIWRAWNGSIFTSQTRSITVPTAWAPVSP